MLRHVLRMGFFLGLAGLVLVRPPAPARQPTQPTLSPAACAYPPQPPGPGDRNDQTGQLGELTTLQKTTAFASVLAGQQYGDYRFPLYATTTLTTPIQPVLLKSIAGIESDWQQYRAGATLVGPTCDYGLLQINAGVSELFTASPSLRADTRANIAAGATLLAAKWNAGIQDTLPLVNEADPDWLLNWYYALSSYNGGPGPNGWANNPNCGNAAFPRLQAGCNQNDFRASRTDTPARWPELAPEHYPYQERILYNLQYPRASVTDQWGVGELGLLATTAPADTGIRPDDAVFVHDDGRSRAPNLLLFRHRAAPANTALLRQPLTFEYDLPLTATVTIDLLDAAGAMRARLVEALPGRAGWQTTSVVVPLPIRAGDRYRIRAEHGTDANRATWYLGQYTQQLDTYTRVLFRHVALPLIAVNAAPPLLRNSDFARLADVPARRPADWELQTIASATPTAALLPVASYAFYDTVSRRLMIRATPHLRVELRQRVELPPGRYTLALRLASAGRDPRAVLILRTRALTVPTGTWREVQRFRAPSQPADGHPDGGAYIALPVDLAGPTLISALVEGAPDDTSAWFALKYLALLPA